MEDPRAKHLMETYSRLPITMQKGSGSWLWDTEGKKYLDYTTGIAVNNLGHCHPKIAEAIVSQATTLVHTSNLFNIENQSALGEMLISNSFADRVFFCNSGTEAVEGSIKLARRWGAQNGGRHAVISTEGAFHGRTFGALSATGSQKYREGFSPFLEGFHFAPYAYPDAIARLAAETDCCAVILEPVQGENGVIVPPSGYLRQVREICGENDMLLILDEIQVGMGRTGKLFAYEHEDVRPDIVALAKALGGGVPCGAVLATEEVAKHFTPGAHGSTFGGNPLAAGAACATIETILKENLPERAGKLGDYFLEKLEEIRQKYPEYIKNVRGKGLIIGVEFFDRDFARDCFSASVKNGLLVILTVERVFRILPPLNTSEEEIDFAVAAITKSIEEVVSNG
ncbi:MAG: aspartate aminotransferase family protein [Candidatus Dadabacteria bacterium]|nr:aspartate aminotransferase family protein [Candidatus Dadabacteria bacterium]MYA48525.1 aspartate aminotransferase family protein [Candidatus Dadabacteria bacterium]MYF47785.1 aspartate aminotransferase family protein [Candidatus Dadabacteria bacterium]MYG82298.1 aspartate aminotransferase family protein [Candidatus Dadabacteria bacterium]MYK49513.1 aspartate aminotransferase family protein [Candidatus Dadabacteria bacterium]